VPAAWQLLTEEPAERARLPSLRALLDLPSEPAGPPNRARRVLRVVLDGGVFFLKITLRTQWKNRLRYRLTEPLARDDAERELLVTRALRDAGIGAPRPVAYGRDGETSYYLCAALPGRSLAEFATDAGVDAELLRASAAFCGGLLARGFRLPDLSADHVFAERRGPAWAFSVLDLANGSIAPPGAAPHRLCVRVLRRFARSVRTLPVGPESARRFALRLLHAAGRRGPAARSVLDALPNVHTAARYEAAGKSASYAGRDPRRAERERRLLERVWPGRPGETVLDLPCGAGRLLPFLEARDHRVVQADGAFAMLRQARAQGHAAMAQLQADALSVPFQGGAVDGVVMFRFLHHLPGEARRRAIAEACRTARRFVAVTFFHPCSAHHLRRWLRGLGGAPRTRHAITLRRLRREFATHGFGLAAHAAELPFAKDLWLASFEREPALTGAG
jgi:SAM-dependent methyltransferase